MIVSHATLQANRELSTLQMLLYNLQQHINHAQIALGSDQFAHVEDSFVKNFCSGGGNMMGCKCPHVEMIS